MEIEIKKLKDSEVEIVGEISAADFESYRAEAVKNLSQNVKIDGFRPGNAPEKILMDKIGEPAILEEMAGLALKKFYSKIIEENKIQAIGRPEISIIKIAKDNPLGFKIKTAVMPEIELADYKKIANESMTKKEEEIKVEDKEIESVVESLRKSRAEKNEKGEEVLPELTDELVKTLGNFENMGAFMNAIRENLVLEKKAKAKEKKRVEILDKVIDSSKIEAPKILIDSEKSKMLAEMKNSIGQMGLKWEDYLTHLKKTEEEILNGWEKDAVKRVKYGLIINDIADKEKIEVLPEELDKETDKISEHYEKTGQKLDRNRVKEYAYGIIRNEKVFKFLESC